MTSFVIGGITLLLGVGFLNDTPITIALKQLDLLELWCSMLFVCGSVCVLGSAWPNRHFRHLGLSMTALAMFSTFCFVLVENVSTTQEWILPFVGTMAMVTLIQDVMEKPRATVAH